MADSTKTTSATVTLSPVVITLSPSGTTSLNGGQSVTFTAKVTDASNTAVTWSLSSQVGTITNGIYQAPEVISSQQSVTVTSTSFADHTKFARTATVALKPVVVTLSAGGTTSLTGGQSVAFTAKLTGTSNTAVTWSLNPQVGTITTGVYQAPAIVASQQNVEVIATIVVDPTKFGNRNRHSLKPVAVTVSSSGATSLTGGQSATFTAKAATGTFKYCRDLVLESPGPGRSRMAFIRRPPSSPANRTSR